jgi:hypothetical protein
MRFRAFTKPDHDFVVFVNWALNDYQEEKVMANRLKARSGKDRRTLKLGPLSGWMERRCSVERRKPRARNFFF